MFTILKTFIAKRSHERFKRKMIEDIDNDINEILNELDRGISLESAFIRLEQIEALMDLKKYLESK